VERLLNLEERFGGEEDGMVSFELIVIAAVSMIIVWAMVNAWAIRWLRGLKADVRTIQQDNAIRSAAQQERAPNQDVKHNSTFCKHCGRSIPSDSEFCEYCGKKLSERN
jgi:hypothetical protein